MTTDMRTLRFKIMALAGLLVLVSQSGTIAVVLVALNRDAGIRAERSLENAGATTHQLARRRGNQLQIDGTVLAADPYFRGAIVAGDTTAAAAILEAQQQRTSLDLGMLLDPRGDRKSVV